MMTNSVRMLANMMMAWLLLFLAHRYFMFWHGWPNISEAWLALGADASDGGQAGSSLPLIILVTYFLVFASVMILAMRSKDKSLLGVSERYADWSSFLVRFAFWAVFLIGLVDATISALRIENILVELIGKKLDSKIGLAKFRGIYVHYPLMALSLVIAWFTWIQIL